MSIVQHAALIFVGATIAYSQTPSGIEAGKLPEVVQQLKTNYQQAVERGVGPLRERYHADLERLIEQSTRSGKLEEALAIKSEISGDSPGKDAPKLSDAAQRLKKTYEQTVERGTAQLRIKYVEELNRLSEQSTRAGKLDEALAIKNEINADFEEKLIAGKWLWNGSLPFDFKKDGKGNFPGFTWKTTKPFTVEYKWDGVYGTIQFDQNMGGGAVSEVRKAGKKTPLTITRQK
jgi:hypothetical protein